MEEKAKVSFYTKKKGRRKKDAKQSNKFFSGPMTFEQKIAASFPSDDVIAIIRWRHVNAARLI